MKELVKPEKVEKEYTDAQAYCEGGNSEGTCQSSVSCASRVGGNCNLYSADESEETILF